MVEWELQASPVVATFRQRAIIMALGHTGVASKNGLFAAGSPRSARFTQGQARCVSVKVFLVPNAVAFETTSVGKVPCHDGHVELRNQLRDVDMHCTCPYFVHTVLGNLVCSALSTRPRRKVRAQ